jgi:hypothetical protein
MTPVLKFRWFARSARLAEITLSQLVNFGQKSCGKRMSLFHELVFSMTNISWEGECLFPVISHISAEINPETHSEGNLDRREADCACCEKEKSTLVDHVQRGWSLYRR